MGAAIAGLFCAFGLFLVILILGILFLVGWGWWRIFKRAGYPGALGLLMFVPLANVIMFFLLAFAEWPASKKTP